MCPERQSLRFIAGACGWVLFLALAQPSSAIAGGVYFVKEGDTLSGISRIFGVSVMRMVELNHLTSTDVKPGDRIRMPDRIPPPVAPARTAPPSPMASAKHVDPNPAPPPEDAAHHRVDADRILRALCRDENVYHSVAKGDTLSAVARRYSTGLDDLLRLNQLSKRSRLSLGQKILVRRSGPRTHTVVSGDTLTGIASRNNLRVEDLVRLNRLDDHRISVGQRLITEECDILAAAGSAPPPLERVAAGVTPAPPPAGAADLTSSALLDDNSGKVGTPASSSEAAQKLIAFAKTMLNIPYRFGGNTMRGIDCSAYVQRVFGLLDVRLPRTAREQYSLGRRIGRHELAVGDLVFFRTYASFPSHVGIYVGDDLFIHASSMGRKVTIDSMDRRYYSKRFIGARRLFLVDELAGR